MSLIIVRLAQPRAWRHAKGWRSGFSDGLTAFERDPTASGDRIRPDGLIAHRTDEGEGMHRNLGPSFLYARYGGQDRGPLGDHVVNDGDGCTRCSGRNRREGIEVFSGSRPHSRWRIGRFPHFGGTVQQRLPVSPQSDLYQAGDQTPSGPEGILRAERLASGDGNERDAWAEDFREVQSFEVRCDVSAGGKDDRVIAPLELVNGVSCPDPLSRRIPGRIDETGTALDFRKQSLRRLRVPAGARRTDPGSRSRAAPRRTASVP